MNLMLYNHYPVEHCSLIGLLSSVLLFSYSFCYKTYHLSNLSTLERKKFTMVTNVHLRNFYRKILQNSV